MPASVECGRMLVSISLDGLAATNPRFDSLADKESLTRGVPSARQKPSVSSFSTRLHEGQRFICCRASCQLAALKLEFTQTNSLRYCGRPMRRSRSANRGSLRRVSKGGVHL